MMDTCTANITIIHHHLTWTLERHGTLIWGTSFQIWIARSPFWLIASRNWITRWLKHPKSVTKASSRGLEGKYKGQPFRIILVTHDESTFHANDHHKIGWSGWSHKSATGKPQAKGEGESIMVSDF
jgi:hypothetical protein